MLRNRCSAARAASGVGSGDRARRKPRDGFLDSIQVVVVERRAQVGVRLRAVGRDLRQGPIPLQHLGVAREDGYRRRSRCWKSASLTQEAAASAIAWWGNSAMPGTPGNPAETSMPRAANSARASSARSFA